MDYHKLTKKELTDKINKLDLDLPEYGSGKNGGIIKSDLISVLKSNTNEMIFEGEKRKFSDMSSDMMSIIAYKLSGEKLISYCQLNKKFAKVCSKEDFWIKKYKLDFNDYKKISKPLTIRQIYTFKSRQNPKLIKLIQSFSNSYQYLSLKNQIIYYNSALGMIKSLPVNMADYWGTNMVKFDIVQEIVEFFHSSNPFEIDFLTDDTIEDYVNNYIHDEPFLKRILSMYNDIMETDYTFEETFA